MCVICILDSTKRLRLTLCLSEIKKMASMTVSAADLAALEVLLNEFFATQTSNERKREIEQVTVFQNQ